MTATPPSDLEALLKRAVTEDAARPEFYRLLPDCALFVIGDVVDAGGNKQEGAIPPGAQLRLAGIEHEGHSYHLIFTTLARLEAWAGEPASHFQMAARPLFAATRGAYFMLNAGDEYAKPLVPEEIAHLLNPSPAQTSAGAEGTRVKLGHPSVYPHVLVKALKAMFEATPNVLAAHLLYIAYRDDDAPHPLIGVEVAADWPGVSEKIGAVLKAANTGTAVDMMPLDPANPGDVERALLQTPAFYARSIKA